MYSRVARSENETGLYWGNRVRRCQKKPSLARGPFVRNDGVTCSSHVSGTSFPAISDSLIRGCGCTGVRQALDSRRSSSRSTASRISCARPYLPTCASIRSISSGGKRTGITFMFRGGRPIRAALAVVSACRKKTIPFSVDAIKDAVYINDIVYGGKPMVDMDALTAKVRASREAMGVGLNVRFLREDGRPDEFSFATPDRAERFRASLQRQGRTILP